jgi:menaquinone-dependent protoporphyrinogen IX oxidase
MNVVTLHFGKCGQLILKSIQMKGLIVYKGKYGATLQYAEWLGAELSLPVMTTGEMTSEILNRYDYVVIGGSVYVGKLQVRDWLKRVIPVLKNKKVFCFIVCGTPMHKKEKLREILWNNIPPELCTEKHIHFLPGRMIKERLSMFDRFMLKMGAKMQKDPEEGKAMLQDVDNVKKEHLTPLVNDVFSSVLTTWF